MSLRLPLIDLFRKSSLLFALLLAITLQGNAQGLFSPVADAVNTGGNCYRLTTADVSRRGAVWYNNKIDLFSDFDIQFTLNFGDRSSYSGGDGMAFVLQPTSTIEIGVGGSAKGYGNDYVPGTYQITTPGISPSMAIEYDTYDDNGGTTGLGTLVLNGDYRHLPGFDGAGTVGLGFLTDGLDHSSRVTWNASTQTITFYVDGIQRFTYQRDLINVVFGGQRLVYFGFTAATGGSVNQQSVCFDAVNSTFSSPLTPTLGQIIDACAGGNTGSATINLQGGTSPYIVALNGISHVFTQSGITSNSVTFSNLPADVYSVRVIDGNSVENTALSFTIHDNPAPVITASGPLTFCQGGSVLLTASTGTSYLWSTGETTQSITVSASGSYTVSIANGSCGSNSEPTIVTVNPSPATPALSVSGATTFCEGGSVVINVTNVEPGVSYQWLKSVGGSFANPISGETGTSILVTTTGRYTVMVTNSCGTIASGTYEITVNPLPTGIVVTGETTVCKGSSTTLTAHYSGFNPVFTWYDNNLDLVYTGKVFTTPPLTNTPFTTYFRKVTDDNGCTTGNPGEIINIRVNDAPPTPTISASGSLVLCSYNSVVLTSSSATGNTWSNGATTQSITVLPANAGSYTVTVSDGTCSATSAATVVSNAPAFVSSITASGPTLICTGSSVTYTLQEPVPSVSRTWYRYADGTYDPTFNETGLSIVVTKSGNYGVNILDSYGCYSNPPGSHDVTVLPPPTKPLAFTVTGSGECTTNAGSVAATIDFSSGVAPINMTWDDGNGFITNAQSLNNVPAGIYTATVYDYCGTTVVKTFTVTGPVTPATISATATNVCAGNTSTLSVNNIDALLTYQWYVNGNPIIGATGTSYEASTAGNYQVLASNGGCSAYSNGISITVSSPLTVNIISNATSCINGGGYAFASPVGGAAPVSFEGWTGPNGYTSNNPNISSLLVGTYTASYRDGCGNLASASVTINAATPVILPSITASKPYCVNGEDVVLTLGPTSYSFAWVEYDASNATQPYNWAFSPNQYSITVNKPGMQYYVVHTDANNCNSFSQGANFFTTLPSPISFSVTSSPSCGTNTGTAQIYNITGGKSPVTYSWTDGASFSSTNGFISNLSSGTYTVTAIDACATAVSQSVTITGQITAATITTTTQNICSGSSAVLSVTNFNPAYSYQWIREGVIIPGATGASYSAALQGFYYVRVSDGVCSADANGIYISVAAAPSLTVYATPSCGGPNAGSAFIQSVSGGMLPFTYAWTDGNSFSSTSQVLNNLAAGNYTVTVTDACGAQDSKLVTINQLPAVIGTISGLPAICTLGGSTTLTASTNGTPATYAWHKTIAGVTSYDIASTPAISASEAGHYWVTIRDVNGCFSTPGVTVTAAGAPLTITVTGTVSCGPSSGSARVVYSGGTAPITVAWTNGGTFSSTSTQITQLAPGTYTATVTEGCGTSIAQSFTVIAGQVTSTTVSKSGPTTICSGDAVTLSAVYNSVVPAASYRWSRFDDGIMVNNYATAQSINVTEGGTYQVFVTNAYGCISSSPITDVFVTIPRTPTVVADGPVILCPEASVNLTATGNSNQSKYSLQFNGSNYVEAPHQSYMGLTKKLTVEAWFKTDDAGTVQYIVSKGIDDYTPGQYGLVLVNSKVEFHLFMNGIHQAVQSTTSIENGKWYHAAGTWDSTRIIMYVNGVAEGQKVFVGPMTANTEPLQIGRLGKPGALYNFKGEIDEVRIWNTALTEAQINTAKGLIVNYSNTMVANYRFEAGTGTTVADNGYGNPATMIGSPQWTVSTAPFYNYTPTYLWSPGGATTSTLNVNTAGSYTVTVNAGGCTNTSDPIIITSLPVATITASGSLTLLPGQTVTLTASAGTSYVWSNGATTPSIVVSSAEAGSYTVAVTNNGCNSTSTPTVVSAAAAIAPVINVPAAISVNNDPGTCGAIVNFTATETTGIPASTITYSHAPGSIFPIGITTVTATATSAAGVSSNTFTVTVTDNEKPAFVIIAPGTATVTIPAMQTFVGNCTMIPFNFLDPLPAGAVVTGIDLNYSGQDQGWGYTGGNDDLYVSGTKVASSVYAHETKTFNTSYAGPIPGYVYGGNNVFGFVFTCYPGWQGFINGGTMTIRYTTNLGPKTVNSDPGKCDATLTLSAPVTSDNCGIASVTNDAPAVFPVGTTNVTWTVMDVNGNSNTAAQAVTVIDNQAPVVATQNMTVQLVNGVANITPAQINNGSTDNCGIAGYSLDKTSFDCTNIGSNTVTLTVTDIHGNAASATATVEVTANTTSEIINAAGPTTFCPGGSVTLTANTGTAYLWSTGETTQSITVAQTGNYTVTVTNALGCTTVLAPVSVSVADITPPVPDLPSLPVISIAPNGLIPAPTATDDCSGVSITGTTTDQIINLLSGTYNIIWTFSDASGNTSTQTQTVIVADMAPPSLKAMNRIVKNNDPGVCGAMVTYVMPVANDNASTTKVTINEGGGDGVITFNTPLSQNVTSLDFISAGEYQDIVHGHGVDIAIQVELYNPQSGSWTLVQTVQTGTTDYHFGGTSVHFPAISQVSQIRFTASQPVYAAFHFYEMSVNLNSIAAVQTAGLPSGSVFPIGTTLNTFRAVDFSGNEAVTSFIVEVLDAEKPRMGNYSSVTYPAGAGGTWTGSAATIAISDNCGSETLQLTEEYFDQRGNRFYQGQSAAAQGNLVLGSRTFPVGTNTVVVSIRDAAGNISDRARFNVSITDITAPTIVVSGNMTQTADPGVCAAWVKVPIPVTSDNCSVQSVANSFNGSPSAAGRYPVGTTVVTWTVTDGSGNKTTAVQTITVIDNEAPVLINVPVSMIQTNDAGSCGAVVTWDAVRATDNCGLISFVSDHQSGETFPLGETVVTFTATDRNGNIGRSSFTITVKDNEAPKVITRPVTVTLVNGSATILPSAINNGSTDNCSAVTLTASKTVFTCADAGVNKVTLTATDANGNVSSAIALVTVIGEVPTSAITVVPSNSIYTGGVPTDIYLGYGPQSVTLSTTVTGTVPVSYSWTGSSGLSCTTCANPVFTPTAAGSYSFTVVATNSYGCTTTSSVTICVRDIRVPNSIGRIYVCHTDLNTGVTTTLSLTTNTVANQLLQNPQDKLGSCGMAPCSQVIVTAAPDVPKTISPEVVEKMTKETSGSAITGLAVKASPNPTNDVFTFMITSPGKLPVHIRLLNEAGKMEESRSNIQLGSAFTMGRILHSGVYFAEVIQGKERVVVKLIKMVR